MKHRALAEERESVFRAKLTEQRCQLDKHYMQHWAVVSLPTEFIVANH